MRGVRYDHVTTNIHSYNDWFKTPINATDSVYKQRSQDLHRSFTALHGRLVSTMLRAIGF